MKLFSRPVRTNIKRILICGITLSVVCMLYLSLCTMPSDADADAREIRRDKELKFKKRHLVESKPIQTKLTVDLVIVIITAVQNYDRRTAIRSTWLKGAMDTERNVLIRFVIGTKGLASNNTDMLIKENSSHQDILLLENTQESYNTLTTKLLDVFVWLERNVQFAHLLKLDDDSFVNFKAFYTELDKKPKEKLYWGFFDGRAHVHKVGKWAESDWILCDRYLPYALGGGYVVSSDLIQYISQNHNLFKKFNGEDVSLGVWLAPLDIYRIHEARFDTEFKSRGCINSYIITHKQSIAQMEEKWTNLQKIGQLCTTENRARLSYIYNWDAAPTRCCIRNDSSVP